MNVVSDVACYLDRENKQNANFGNQLESEFGNFVLFLKTCYRDRQRSQIKNRVNTKLISYTSGTKFSENSTHKSRKHLYVHELIF